MFLCACPQIRMRIPERESTRDFFVRRIPLAVQASPRGWGSAERPLERARESGFGIVADTLGNLGNGRAGVAELLGRDLHAPSGKVVHRRRADQTNEAVGQSRAR